VAKPARAAAPKTAAEPSEVERLKAQIAELNGQLASTSQERDEARQTARAAEERGMSEIERRLRAEAVSNDTAMAALDSMADQLVARIGELSDEPGHGKEIAQLQRELAENAADRRDAKNRKTFLESQIDRAKTEGEARAKAPAKPEGRVLANGAPLSGFAPATQEWFKAHPESFSDKGFMRRAVAAAIYATDIKGLAENTREYFEEVENQLGLRQSDDDDHGEDLGTELPARATADSPYSQPASTRQASTKRPAVVGDELTGDVERPQPRAAGPGAMSLPVTRNVPQGNRARGRLPDLSAEEREVAEDLRPDLPPAEAYLHYAQNRQIMQTKYPGKFAN
jgi:hypothetical protein